MILVFDIGATKTRLALSMDGVTLERPHIIPTDTSEHGPKTMVAAMVTYAKKHKIQHIAGGVAGTIERSQGILLESPNLPEWRNVHLGQMIAEAFRAKVMIENDTAMVGLGEVTAGYQAGIAVYVTVSTGVNAARFVDGEIDDSTYGFEAGRQLIPSKNGRVMTLEELIGGHALQLRYGRLPREIDEDKVWERECEYLARGLYNMMLLWSPRVMILGGSMMRDIPLPLVQHYLTTLPEVFPWPQLVEARLGEYGGLYGALTLIAQTKSDRKQVRSAV